MKPIPLHAFNPSPLTGDGNWTWLIPGRVPTLIDAGTGDPRHVESLDLALGGAALAQVLVTHSHSDHAAGAPVLTGRAPAPHFRKMLWPGRDDLWPAPWEAVADGDEIEAGDTTLVALHTPGHAPDHLSFWHEETRTLFCGDLAVSGTTVWIPAADLEGDLAAYLWSLSRVLALMPRRMLPAHGPVIEDPETLLRNYIRHRLDREVQIVGALRVGDTQPEQIVRRIYRGLKEHLRPFAEESVLAHLIKLQRDGRAVRSEDGWHIMSG